MNDTSAKHPKRVVGVSYDVGDVAPKVMLKASGTEADSVLQEAALHKELSVVRDPVLVNELYRIPIDAPIGRELFPVMALLLAHVLSVDKSRSKEQA